MNPRDRKQAVLHILSREWEPISLPELLKKLGPGYAERTVRRWVNEMVEEGILEKIGQKRGTKYRTIYKKERGQNGITSCFG